MSNFGSFCLLLALCLAVYGIFASLLGVARKQHRIVRSAEHAALAATAVIAVAFFSLLYLLITSDFSVSHVASASNRDLPLFYKIAAVWGAHDGSMLLWVFITSIFSGVAIYQNRYRYRDMMPTDGPTLTSLSTQYNDLLTQIGQLAGDSGFNGVNLLGGDSLTIKLDETGTSTTTVTGVTYTGASPLGIANAANNWGSPADITVASGDLTAALTTLRAESQTLSASLSVVQIRQDFTKATINTLQTGSDNLTLADSNQEGANLLALQTRQQLSSTALSLASQADQNVLRLFR